MGLILSAHNQPKTGSSFCCLDRMGGSKMEKREQAPALGTKFYTGSIIPRIKRESRKTLQFTWHWAGAGTSRVRRCATSRYRRIRGSSTRGPAWGDRGGGCTRALHLRAEERGKQDGHIRWGGRHR